MNKADPRLALKGTRILIVEDDYLILSALESILADAGAQIVGMCRDIEQALAAVENEPPSVAILDVRVERQSVAPVADALARRNIPFIFYTGQMETDQLRAQWPRYPVISKPAAPGNIVAAVVDVMKHWA